MINGCWIDAGNDPNPAVLKPPGITSCWFDPRDVRITPSYLDWVVGLGFSVGLYWAWDWFPTLSGVDFARAVDREMRHLAWPGNAPVCLDIETHDIGGYVLPALTEWRRLRPKRPTWWTFEGMQGGTFSMPEVASLSTLSVRLAPSMYAGDMSPLPHSVVIDLLMAGFSGDLIDGMYDAAHLPYRWRGFAFSQGRLPGAP